MKHISADINITARGIFVIVGTNAVASCINRNFSYIDFYAVFSSKSYFNGCYEKDTSGDDEMVFGNNSMFVIADNRELSGTVNG